MKAIRLSCTCCSVEVLGYRQLGRARFTVYAYNGEQHIGVEALGKRVGLNADKVRHRLYSGSCLLETTEALKRRKPVGPSVSTGKLASDFCRIMARSFA